jgi:hypothetical protein
MGYGMAFMFAASINKRLWPYALSFANYLCINRLRIITYRGKVTTPYEVINKKKPSISFIRTWGCEAYGIDDRGYDKRNFTEKSYKGHFVGYDRHANAVLIYEPLNDEIIHTCHVRYNEIVSGIRDVNNITVCNLNWSKQPHPEPFSYFEEDDTGNFEQVIFNPENSIGDQHLDIIEKPKIRRHTKSHVENNRIYSDSPSQVNSLENRDGGDDSDYDSIHTEESMNRLGGGFITLGTLDYEPNYTQEHFHNTIDLANRSIEQ